MGVIGDAVEEDSKGIGVGLDATRLHLERVSAVEVAEVEVGVGTMAYLVICRKCTLDLSLAYVVLDNMVPADHRVHGPTAISGQIHGGLRVPLRQTSPHGLGKFGGVGEGNSV